MVDSGAIVSLDPEMCGEIAECKAPSSSVHGSIVQTLRFKGQSRLVVDLDFSQAANHCGLLGDSGSIPWLYKPSSCVHSQVSRYCQNTHDEEWVALSFQGVVLGNHGGHCSEYDTTVGHPLLELKALSKSKFTDHR